MPFREASKQRGEALTWCVAQYFHNAGWKCNNILRVMMHTDNFYATEISQIKPPTLHQGRFVLVGGAAYALGQTGFRTDILASEVRTNKGDIAAGLRGYEEQMGPLGEEMQKRKYVLAPQTAWGIWPRNTLLGRSRGVGFWGLCRGQWHVYDSRRARTVFRLVYLPFCTLSKCGKLTMLSIRQGR